VLELRPRLLRLRRRTWDRLPGWLRPPIWLALSLAVLVMPVLGDATWVRVFFLIALYAMLGMGLNVVVGLAGLLDLGFVAFFATGAYVTALLTADSPLALASYTMIPSLSFWAAMPLAVLAAVAVGILFGVPVLGVRGDYLAVATLGLGEIVRIVVLSDAAAPVLGGAQGILQIPKPTFAGFEFSQNACQHIGHDRNDPCLWCPNGPSLANKRCDAGRISPEWRWARTLPRTDALVDNISRQMPAFVSCVNDRTGCADR